MNQAINDCLAGLNNIGKAFCSHAAGAFVQSALLVILLFAIDLLLRKRVRAVFRYCVWLLVLVKLVLPPTLSLPSGIGYWVGNRIPAASPVSERVSKTIGYEPARQHRSGVPELSGEIPQVQPPSNMAQTDALVPSVARSLTPITWQAVVFLLWLVGVLAFALLLAQRLRFVRGLVAASTPAGGDLLGMLEQCRRQIGVRRQVGLRMLDTVPSPAVCGLLRPIILMPTSLVEKLSSEGLRAALIHELAHIKRADLWVNAVQTFLQVVYFYNPFVWFANAVIRRTCEEAVDETVLVTLGGEAKNYSNTLIDIGEMAFWKADFGLRLIGVAESRKALQGRIKHMLTRPVPKSARIGALGTIAILVVAAVLLPMAKAEKSSKDVPAAGPVAAAEASEKAPPAGESDTIVDPNTGLKFIVTKRITGANNDVFVHNNTVGLSPNGKFLRWRGTIVPLDGGKLVGLHNGGGPDAAWSPDGKLIAYPFHGAIWLLPVAPETCQPTGPARKLFEDRVSWSGGTILWSTDSQWIILHYREESTARPVEKCISAQDGQVVQPPDYTRFSLRSPDQRQLACFRPGNSIWTVPVEGGSRSLVARTPSWVLATVPLWWSPDSQWLLCGESDGNNSYGNLRFVRLADRYEASLRFPEKATGAGFRALGLGVSPDGRKLQYFKNSHDLRLVLKVAPIRGGGFTEAPFSRQFGIGEISAPQGQALVFTGYKQGKSALYVAPPGDREPVEVKLNVSLGGEPYSRLVSPDGTRLLAGVRNLAGARDLYVIPISLETAQSTGPATLICKDWQHPAGRGWDAAIAWSPDSRRLVICGGPRGNGTDLWVVPADGGPAKQLTQSPEEVERHALWSPDGKLIAYTLESAGQVRLYTVPAEGGTSKRLWTQAAGGWSYTWSPDSKEIEMDSKDGLVSVAVADGVVRPFLKLTDAHLTWLDWLQWSPDGQTLALVGGDDVIESQTALYRASDKKAELLPPDPVYKETLGWTRDSQAIFCLTEQPDKVLPAALIYEVDLEEALQKVVAAAPPIQDKPSGSKAGPQAQPIAGPLFTDDFDNGPSQHWRFEDFPNENLPVHLPVQHVVEKGELVLSNARAYLDGLNWTDYVVTTRVCLKETAPSGYRALNLYAPTVSNQLGPSSRVDEHELEISWSNSADPFMWLGINYTGPSGEGRGSELDRCPCSLAPDKWYTLEFEVRGPHLRAYLDGKLMVEGTDEWLSQGKLCIVANQICAHFDDFSVRQLR